jgi:hypothetical protein
MTLPDGQITLRSEFPVQPSRVKYSASPKTQIKLISFIVSSRTRGGSRSSRTLGWDAVDATVSCAQLAIAGRFYRERSGRAGRTALMRTVKSCGPGTRCWCQVSRRFRRPDRAREAFNPRDDGDKKELVAGESAKDPVKTTAQGRPDDPGYTCGSCRVLFCCTRAMGAAGTRPSLRPRHSRDKVFASTRGAQTSPASAKLCRLFEIQIRVCVLQTAAFVQPAARRFSSARADRSLP